MVLRQYSVVLLSIFLIFSIPSSGLTQEYVPLNSLTISSLYQESEEESLTSTEKAWWTDLQEQREIYKAGKLREQQLQINNGKIIPMKINILSGTTTSRTSQVEELPKPLEQGTETKPDEVIFPQGSILFQSIVYH